MDLRLVPSTTRRGVCRLLLGEGELYFLCVFVPFFVLGNTVPLLLGAAEGDLEKRDVGIVKEPVVKPDQALAEADGTKI